MQSSIFSFEKQKNKKHAYLVVNLIKINPFNFPLPFLTSQSHNSLFVQGLFLKHVPFTLGCPYSFLQMWLITLVHFCFIPQVLSDLADVWKYLCTWSVMGTDRAVGLLSWRCVVQSQHEVDCLRFVICGDIFKVWILVSIESKASS